MCVCVADTGNAVEFSALKGVNLSAIVSAWLNEMYGGKREDPQWIQMFFFRNRRKCEFLKKVRYRVNDMDINLADM